MSIENELRASFHRQAAAVPAAAIDRITAGDYHPRSRRRMRRPLAVGLSGAAAFAAAGGAVLALLGNAAPAFAGWSPTPTTPRAGQLAAATARCRASVPDSGLPLALSDTRGPYTFEIFATDRTRDTCLSGPSVLHTDGITSDARTTVPADRLMLAGDHATIGPGATYSIAEGRAGAGVTAATFTLDDGSRIRATVRDGWFVAWWPSAHTVRSATLRTVDGPRTQTFVAPGTACSPRMCTSQGTSTDSRSGAAPA